MKKLALLLSLFLLAATAVSEHPWQETTTTAATNKEHLVLLHGLGRSRTAMWWLATRLEDAGYHVTRIGYSSLNHSPEEIIAEVSEKINACCAQHQQPVHFSQS